MSHNYTQNKFTEKDIPVNETAIVRITHTCISDEAILLQCNSI